MSDLEGLVEGTPPTAHARVDLLAPSTGPSFKTPGATPHSRNEARAHVALGCTRRPRRRRGAGPRSQLARVAAPPRREGVVGAAHPRVAAHVSSLCSGYARRSHDPRV